MVFPNTNLWPALHRDRLTPQRWKTEKLILQIYHFSPPQVWKATASAECFVKVKKHPQNHFLFGQQLETPIQAANHIYTDVIKDQYVFWWYSQFF